MKPHFFAWRRIFYAWAPARGAIHGEQVRDIDRHFGILGGKHAGIFIKKFVFLDTCAYRASDPSRCDGTPATFLPKSNALHRRKHCPPPPLRPRIAARSIPRMVKLRFIHMPETPAISTMPSSSPVFRLRLYHPPRPGVGQRARGIFHQLATGDKAAQLPDAA